MTSDYDLEDSLKRLLELGLIDIEYDESLNAKFRINEKGIKVIDTMKDIFRG